jgi:hypothetical protein
LILPLLDYIPNENQHEDELQYSTESGRGAMYPYLVSHPPSGTLSIFIVPPALILHFKPIVTGVQEMMGMAGMHRTNRVGHLKNCFTAEVS